MYTFQGATDKQTDKQTSKQKAKPQKKTPANIALKGKLSMKLLLE